MKKRTRKTKDEMKLLLKQLALLVSESQDKNLSRQEIAKQLGLTEQRFSQLVQKAKDKSLLVQRFTTPFNDNEKKWIRSTLQPTSAEKTIHELKQIGSRLSESGVSRLKEVVIVDCESGSSDPFSRIRRFGSSVAPVVRELLMLNSCRKVGVCWGRSLNCVAQGINGIARTSSNNELEFMPLWGEPYGKMEDYHASEDFSLVDLSSTDLCVQFAKAMNSAPYEQLSLSRVPALIPIGKPEVLKISVANCRRLMSSFSDMAAIFADDESSKRRQIPIQVDAILAAAGSPISEKWSWNGLDPSMKEEFKNKLREEAIGDFGGVLLPKANLRSHPKIRICMNHWLGLQDFDLDEVAKNRSPGVIGFGVGIERADTCLAAIERNWINHLFVDIACFNAIAGKLNSMK